VAYCPTGALFDKMSVGKGRAGQATKVRTTCSFCGVGCNFDLHVRSGKIIRVTSAQDAPVNGLALCVKGRYGYDYVHNSQRLLRPLVRAKWLDPAKLEQQVADGGWQVMQEAGRRSQAASGKSHDEPDNPLPIAHYLFTSNQFIAVDWDTALDVVAHKLAAEKKLHGGRSFAMLASAKCSNEENFLLAKLTRQLMTTNSIDHCARL
jgi:predicted molibdopterin-dependent oxidoreductase YjgC